MRTDIISGITVWAVMVPVAMAYAEMAGLPPQYGLYTAFAALLGYAIFGTSRQLKVTTSSTMAVMSAAVVVAIAGGDPARYAALTAALALTVGLILLLAGIVRLGFISDFLSKSVVTGFVFGLALVIAIGQLPKLLGLPSGQGDFFEQAYQLITKSGGNQAVHPGRWRRRPDPHFPDQTVLPAPALGAGRRGAGHPRRLHLPSR